MLSPLSCNFIAYNPCANSFSSIAMFKIYGLHADINRQIYPSKTVKVVIQQRKRRLNEKYACYQFEKSCLRINIQKTKRER